MLRIQRNDGYALVAAMMIMLLTTALGALAMVTSVSEQYITTNLGEGQMLFFYAEQGVDRILSHLHNLEGGLFADSWGLGFDPQQAGNDLAPKQVLNAVKALYHDGSRYQQREIMRISAYVDPKDFEGAWDRGISRPIAININVTNTRTSADKSFRVYARPRSVWDFAYFSLNNQPSARSGSSPLGENCNTASPNWYACQSAFLDGDTVIGDTYLSNIAYTQAASFAETYPDTGRLFVRGSPSFAGEVRWRAPDFFDNVGQSSTNQTKGGAATYRHPTVGMRFKPSSRPVLPPKLDVLFDTGQGYRNSNYYDLKFGDAGDFASGTPYIWRLIFRNDIDTNGDGVKANSWVGSAITPMVNQGSSPTLGSPANEDRGVMMIYRIPFTSGTALEEEINMQVAFFGRTMAKRDSVMRARDPDARWSPSASWKNRISGKQCSGFINVPPGNTTGDIAGGYDYMYVPSRGLSTAGSGSGCGGTYNGVIVVEGDVIVSGILDAQLTIVASGDIYLDHEIEYENNPMEIKIHDYANMEEPDILGLFAGGNVILPNSYPDESYIYRLPIDYWSVNRPWRDDWSDPHNPLDALRYARIGFNDDPASIYDDVGDEDIHAVILSYGQNCTVNGASWSCTPPLANSVKQFRVGFHATPRTKSPTSWVTRPNIEDPAYPAGGLGFDMDGGNDSGWLTVVGAVIQNIPGRLAYDYYRTGSNQSSTCTTGHGTGCHRTGFSKVSYFQDPRLKYMLPPYPRDMRNASGANLFSSYGFAAWEIISWEELRSNTDISAEVW